MKKSASEFRNHAKRGNVATILIQQPTLTKNWIMKIKDFTIRFLITFGIGLIATILMTLCWNYFIKGNGLIVDWETSFRTALILAIVIPLTQIMNK
jgi:hypothetical protein